MVLWLFNVSVVSFFLLKRLDASKYEIHTFRDKDRIMRKQYLELFYALHYNINDLHYDINFQFPGIPLSVSYRTVTNAMKT